MDGQAALRAYDSSCAEFFIRGWRTRPSSLSGDLKRRQLFTMRVIDAGYRVRRSTENWRRAAAGEHGTDVIVVTGATSSPARILCLATTCGFVFSFSQLPVSLPVWLTGSAWRRLSYSFSGRCGANPASTPMPDTVNHPHGAMRFLRLPCIRAASGGAAPRGIREENASRATPVIAVAYSASDMSVRAA